MDAPTAASWTRCTHDQRLHAQVVRAGTRWLPEHIKIPRSTASTWRRRGQRPVVTIEPFDQNRQQLVDTIAKLGRRVRILPLAVILRIAHLEPGRYHRWNRGWLRPRQRVHPPKPTVGVRASQPNEICPIDTALINLIDTSSTCQVLLAAGKHLVIAGRFLLYADSGVENVNSAVDATLSSACLERILSQIEVAFSNSLIETYWRSLKHQWLFLNTLDSV